MSDAVGRKAVFAIMFLSQAVLYMLLPKIANITMFGIMASYLLICWGRIC
jgi:OFA family oxalate/formate antiporter-like MFS transporter